MGAIARPKSTEGMASWFGQLEQFTTIYNFGIIYYNKHNNNTVYDLNFCLKSAETGCEQSLRQDYEFDVTMTTTIVGSLCYAVTSTVGLTCLPMPFSL